MILISSTIFGLIVIGGTLGAVTFLILLERKVAAYMQNRIGPNRVGPRGLLQTVADAIKLLFKEDFIPGEASKFLFFLGPSLVMLGAMLVLAAIPFGGRWQIDGWSQAIPLQIVPDLDVGIVYVVSVALGTVYGVFLGGWASNNKYSFFGGMRTIAQVLSYEVPLGVCLLCVFLLVADLRLEVVVRRQMGSGWLFFYQPAVFFIMLVTVFAETNRLPFDTPEAEQEIIAGYHTEYSSLEFGMYFLGEYAHLIASSALLVTLFFGGWHFPGLTPDVTGGFGQTILKLIIFTVKTTIMLFIFMWARWTLPRFRFDQVLRLGWTGLLPVAMILLVITGIFTYFHLAWTVWMTLANVGVLAGALAWSWLFNRASPPRQWGDHESRNLPASRTPDQRRVLARRNRNERKTMEEKDIVYIKEPKLTAGERIYVTALAKGFFTTLRHLFGRKFTLQYPEQRRKVYAANYRGFHRLNRDNQGRVKCVACMMCETACPAHCIFIHAAPAPWPDREKYPETFVIDELRCIYCGMCEQACPVDAIQLTQVYEPVSYTRQQMMYDKEMLLEMRDRTVREKPEKKPNITDYDF